MRVEGIAIEPSHISPHLYIRTRVKKIEGFPADPRVPREKRPDQPPPPPLTLTLQQAEKSKNRVLIVVPDPCSPTRTSRSPYYNTGF